MPRRLTHRRQPTRCICAAPADAHRQHARPSRGLLDRGTGTGVHLDPRCPHSTLYQDTVASPRSRERRPRRIHLEG